MFFFIRFGKEIRHFFILTKDLFCFNSTKLYAKHLYKCQYKGNIFESNT